MLESVEARTEKGVNAGTKPFTSGTGEGFIMTAIYRLARDKMALVGLGIIIVIVAVGIFAPYLAPHDPVQVDLGQKLARPSAEYPLGTDHLGRCILSRLIYGTPGRHVLRHFPQ